MPVLRQCDFALFADFGPEFIPTMTGEHQAYAYFSPHEIDALHTYPTMKYQIDVLLGNQVAMDRWITVHPNGPDSKGQPVLIDGEGVVQGGMGGKFNGKKIDNLNGPDHKAETAKPAEPAKPVERAATTHANTLSSTAKT